MDDVVRRYRQAVEDFGARVHAVPHDRWHVATPCDGWDVSQLVNHVVSENAWAVSLLAGSTLAEVGDRLDGDLLGGAAVAAWDEWATAAVAAAGAQGVEERTVHVSFGDIPGREYLAQLTTDHVIHAWDLARGAGLDEGVDTELAEFAYRYLEPQADGWRAAGVFGPRVAVPDDAPVLQRLLALSGRQG